ncbi:MAG: sigma-70 family RNA polymerase sigma factor [Planctomycetota bacterium]|jgi:RNA polymerase sigma factor (sigma-70 family)
MKAEGVDQAVKNALDRGFLSLEKLDQILEDDSKFDDNVERLNLHFDDEIEIEIPKKSFEGNGSNGSSLKETPPSNYQQSIPAPYSNKNHRNVKMSREEERCMAKRMEFFKRRLMKVIEHAKLTPREKLVYLRDIHCIRPTKDSNGTFKSCLICEKVGSCPKRKKGLVHTTCKAYHKCRTLFVERNMHIVVFIAQPYSTYGIPIVDLVQEGNAALIRAVEKFDWRKQVRLQTYAEFWIRQAVERLINANKWIVRVPTYMQQRMRRIRRQGKLAADWSRVTSKEVSEAFKTSPVVARHLLETERGYLSLDSIVKDGESVRPADLIADKAQEIFLPEEVDKRTRLLHDALARLSDQERTIIQHRFEMNGAERKTLSELGMMLSISRERVRQIEARTLEKLKKPKMLGSLKHYF